ncbi:MAG: ABC transporter permease [Thermaerobacter sp.]|nr:ABC transporter permease [Thermaerobacter sp.]
MNALAIAWDSIWHHRTRSLLTALGIVIGVFAVVTLTSLGGAVKTYVNQKFSGVGANLMTVIPALPQASGHHPHFGRGGGAGGPNAFISVPSTLTPADLQSLLKLRHSAIQTAAATLAVPQLIMRKGVSPGNASVLGVTSAYFRIQNSRFEAGRFSSAGVVLGHSLAQEFFGKKSPVGQSVAVGGSSYTVSGVLKPVASAPGSHPNTTAFLPLPTALKLAHQSTVSNIIVAAKSASLVNKASRQVTRTLLKTHRSHNFRIETAKAILNTVTSTTSVITDFLAGIAGISLLVGGIGIMNIMLVTVSERFREIGVRKALGARDADILVQFLAESVLLALIGGALGTILAGIATHVVGQAIGLSANLTTESVVVATAFSLSVGAVFGVLPAMRAARLMPADALRTE